MFGFKKKERIVELASPVNGKMIDLKEVPDKVFASEMMGPGVAFISNDGKIYSPCDGELITVFPTKHAIGIKANNGAEILIHFGLDTVQLEGKGFRQVAKEGQRLKKGDLILDVDIVFLQKKGYAIETPMVITNSDEFYVKVNKLANVSTNTEVVILYGSNKKIRE